VETLVSHVAAGLEIAGRFPELAGREVILSDRDPDGLAAASRYDAPNVAYRNTEYYASFLATTVCRLLDVAGEGPRVDAMLTWAFQFEGREYLEGLRTLSTNGIDNPVLNVFRMLAMLGGSRLALTVQGVAAADAASHRPLIHGLAAADGSGGVQVLLCNHHDDWDVTIPSSVSVSVGGLEPGIPYRLRHHVIDAERCNAHTVWRRLGAPRAPSAEELTALRRAGRLTCARECRTAGDERGRVAFALTLAGHSVTLVALVPE